MRIREKSGKYKKVVVNFEGKMSIKV